MDFFKQILLHIVLVITFFIIDIAVAQRGGIGPGRGLFGGPMYLALQYDNFDPVEAQQVKAILAFRKPLGMSGRPTARPSGKSPVSGYISTVNLAAGIRFLPEDSTDFRWRAGLLDANINTKNIVFGLILLDYDQSEIAKEYVRWFKGRFGIGRTFGSRIFSIRPQMAVAAGYSRIKFGLLNYSELNQSADSTISGLEAGYSTSITVDLYRRFILSADIGERIIIDDIEPHIKLSGIQTAIRINKGTTSPLFIYFRYEKERTKIATTSLEQNNNRFLAGISYTIIPSPPQRDPFDW